jgi:hypothetical protein
MKENKERRNEECKKGRVKERTEETTLTETKEEENIQHKREKNKRMQK